MLSAQSGTGNVERPGIGPFDCGITDTFYVRAFNAAGLSSKSNVDTADTTPCANNNDTFNITVEFTRVEIKDDTDADLLNFRNPGEIRLSFMPGPSTLYYPNEGHIELYAGDIAGFSRIYTTTLTRNDSLRECLKTSEKEGSRANLQDDQTQATLPDRAE